MSPTDAPASWTDTAPVTVAAFPNWYEAELARAALDSQAIPAAVHNDHGQYLSAAPWVHVQVARVHREIATEVLERGPLHGRRESDEAEGIAPEGTPDDLAPLRPARRFTVTRWFLYAEAVRFSLSGFLLPLSLANVAMALWSKSDPRRAFGVACGVQAVVVFVSISIAGVPLLTELIPLLAFYFAWVSTAPARRPELVASPDSRLRSVEIGDSWKVVEQSDARAGWPTWVLHDLIWFVVASMVVLVLEVALRAG